MDTFNSYRIRKQNTLCPSGCQSFLYSNPDVHFRLWLWHKFLTTQHCTCIKLFLLPCYVQACVVCDDMINFRGTINCNNSYLNYFKDLINSCFSIYKDAFITTIPVLNFQNITFPSTIHRTKITQFIKIKLYK